MRIGDAALANEPLKAVFMDPPGSLGRYTDFADVPHPINRLAELLPWNWQPKIATFSSQTGDSVARGRLSAQYWG